MQLKAITTILTLLLAFQPVAARKRNCWFGAVQCYYENGRCANPCNEIACGCDDVHRTLGNLTKTHCILKSVYKGRHKCGED
ncbi:hypothetical protein LZ30DRAFT_707278 [Colletotrichum cereale]|nr:hypothetical protein LZ30DRAFT_707278 [Colletotrichum cereale]